MRSQDPTRSSPDYAAEIDCPWFDNLWLLEHPDFPLARAAAPLARRCSVPTHSPLELMDSYNTTLAHLAAQILDMDPSLDAVVAEICDYWVACTSKITEFLG